LSSLTRNRVAFGAALVVVFALYRATAIPSVVTVRTRGYPEPSGEYYNALAEALLAGKTSLLVKPSPELLALEDPYDPIKNHGLTADGRPICLHDASLYNGKYYLYYGVTPALTLFAPAIALTGQYLPAAAGALVFAFGGFVWGVLLLNLVIDRFTPGVGALPRFFLAVTFGCCNCVLYLMRSTLHYEVAITSAQFFVLGGLYFLARGYPRDSLRRGSIAFGSLLLGLAIGCRPHMGLVGLFAFSIAAAGLLVRVRAKTISRRELPATAAALTVPWLICVAALGAYNYHRFHSFTDFGTRYTLIAGVERLPDQKLLDPARIWADLYCYLFFPPEVGAKFPYVSLPYPSDTLFPKGNLGHTPMGGLVPGMPFLGFLALAPLTLLRAYRAGRYGFLTALSVLLGVGLGMLLVVSCFSAAMRYTVDFAGFLVLASFLVLIDLDAWCRPLAGLRWTLRGVAAVGMTLGCLFSLSISVEGQRCLLRDIDVRERLAKVFPPLPFMGRPVRVKMQVVFPEQTAAGRKEPLVTTGELGKSDFVYVRYLGDDTVAFAFDHWACPAQEGEAVRVVPGRPYTFEAELRLADGRVVCHLDGQEVLAVDSPIFRFQKSTLRLGYTEIGWGLLTSNVFFGKISDPDVHVPTLRN
jgi:hypothetical protein